MNRNQIKRIVEDYEKAVKGAAGRNAENQQRSKGGIVRSRMGRFVESLAETIIRLAWADLGGDPVRLTFDREQRLLPIKRRYIERIKDSFVRSHIMMNEKDYYYRVKADVHCSIDNRLIFAVECKTFTENAMLKRVLVDFSFMKRKWRHVSFFLLQLESQLGGDYSVLGKEKRLGSSSTHTLLSHFDVDLEIITLLDGERKVKEPIHEKKYFKHLSPRSVEAAARRFQAVLKGHL